MEGGGGGGGGSERRKPKLTSQISVLDPAKIRDLIKTKEDHHNFRRDSSLAGLTVDAVLGCNQGRQTQMVDNQPGRTLLDIICSDEDNSGAAYRGLVAQSNKKNGKQKNNKKSIKDRLRLRRSSRPVPTCDIPISKGRNINISNPFPPQPPKRSNRITSSAAIPVVIDTKQVDDPIVPCYIKEEVDDDEEEEEQQQQQQQQKPMSKNQEEDDDDEEEEQQQQHQPMSKNEEEEDDDDKPNDEDDDDNKEPMSKKDLEEEVHQPISKKEDEEEEDDDEEEQQQQHQPMSKNQEEEDDDKPNDQDDDDDKEPMSKEDLEEEEHQQISKEEDEEDEEDEEEDDDNLEEEEHQQILSNLESRVGIAASGLLMSELRAIDKEINGSKKLLFSKTKKYDDDDDDDDDDYDDDEEEEEEEEEEPVKQVSLMALLEGTMGAEEDDEEEDELNIEEDEIEVGGQYVCCVCMVRHNKGTSFSHCGHSFCRLCCKELYVSKGNCPLCNRYIMEIVEIF